MRPLLEADNEAVALEWLHAERCTDGLPVVIPTPARVERMVLAGGVDANLSLGTMGPGAGTATIEAIATNAVMAGCRPDDMPIVIAAITALLDPTFDLSELQATTHSVAPFILVSGPIRLACGIASGYGALGPGYRANASIGRAVRLAMINIGMARPGSSDMALLGHPGKFTFCMAEDEESSPWEPVHTTLGYGPDESAVTVVGAEPPHSVLFQADADDVTSPTRLLRSLAATLANVGSNNAQFQSGFQTVVLNPDHASVLAAAGMSRADVQQRLVELAVNPRALIHSLNPAFTGADGDDELRVVPDPEHLLVFVGGGGGQYSAVMPSWCGGTHGNLMVHAPVVTGQTCEIPARTS